MKKPAPPKVLDICSDCAAANGGVWPDGHIATVSGGNCDACGKFAGVCSVGDYDWPKGRPKNWIGTGRD